MWNFKASGSYDAPWGIRISPVLRHQSGVELRSRDHDAGGGGAGREHFRRDHYADRAADNREDNIWVFDVRAEKQFTFGSRVRLRLMFDAFNLANSHASETITHDRTSYLKPSAILAPTHSAVGFRFIF